MVVGLGKRGIILFSSEFKNGFSNVMGLYLCCSLLHVSYQRDHGLTCYRVCVCAVTHAPAAAWPGPYLAYLALFRLALARRQLFGIPTKSPPIRAVTPQIFQEP